MTLEEIKKTGDKKAILKYRTQCAKDSVKEYREQMRDATPEEQEAIDKYIKSISKPTGINIFDFYEDGEKNCLNCKHQDFICEVKGCKDYKKWEQADGEYISKDTAIDDITTGLCEEIACSECPFDKPDIICKVQKWLRQLPSVAIPSEHDGCKDCKYETYPDYYYPCCDCKQNYIDKWERAKHWIHRNDDYNDWLECPNCGYGSEGEVKYGEGTPYCPYCGERLEEK